MKIASFTPIWNADLFIKPHFRMLSKLDKNIVLYNPHPWKEYADQHYSTEPDESIKHIKTQFPHVEVITTDKYGYPELVPQALELLSDYDCILRLDVDMLMSEDCFERLINYIKENGASTYKLDWSKYTINYYGDYEHGIKDASEKDEIVLTNKTKDVRFIELENFVIHHFRGWNKPKSIRRDWKDNLKNHFNSYSEWYTVPTPIKDMFDKDLVSNWLNSLA